MEDRIPTTVPPSAFTRSLRAHRAALGLPGDRMGREATVAHVAGTFGRLAHDPFSDLRPHQAEALAAVAARYRRPGPRRVATCIMPTASGKTRIFVDGIAALGVGLPRGTAHPVVVVLVPTRTLIGQVLDVFAERHPHVDVGHLSSIPVPVLGGAPAEASVRTVTVMTYRRHEALCSAGALRPGDVDLLVMDEAHRGLSDLRRDALSPFADDGAALLPMTATPAFSDERSVQAFLGAENVVVSSDPRRLRNEGVIAPVTNYVVGVHIRGRFPPDRELAALMRRKALVDAALDVVGEHVDEVTGQALAGRVAIFYGSDIAHARMFAAEYNRRFAGVARRMVLLTGYDPPERLRAAVDAIHRGEVTAIANAQMLAEGFDLPKVGLVVNSPTDSLVKQLQQSGRAQRIDPALPATDPGQTAFVVDLYYRIDGRILGRPVFYFDAVRDPSLARLVDPERPIEASGIDVSDYRDRDEFRPEGDDGAPPGDAGESPVADPPPRATGVVPASSHSPTPVPPPSPAERGYVYRPVTGEAHIASIVHFMRERDGTLHPPRTEGWVTLSEACETFGAKADRKAAVAAVWAGMEARLAAGLPTLLGDAEVGFARLTLQSGHRSTCLRSDALEALATAASIAVPRWRLGADRPVPVTPDRLGRVALGAAMGTSVQSDRFVRLFDGLEAEAEAILAERDAPISDPVILERGGVAIEMSLRRSRTQFFWTYDAGAAPSVSPLLGLAAAARDASWVNRMDILQGRYSTREHRDFLDGLDAEFAEALARDPDCPGVTRKGVLVRMARLANKSAGNRKTLTHYHRGDVDLVRRLGGLALDRPAKGPGWLNRREAEAAVGGRNLATDALFRGIEAELAAQESLDLPEGPIVRGGRPVRAVAMMNKRSPVVCYHEDDVAHLRGVLGRRPALEGEWLGRRDVARMAGLNPSTHRGFLTVYRRVEALAPGNGILTGPGGDVRCAIRVNQGKPGTCVHADDAGAFLAHVEAETFRADSPSWVDGAGMAVRMAGLGMDAAEARAALAGLAAREGRNGNEGAPFEGPRVVRLRTRVFVHAEDADAVAEALASGPGPCPA